MKDSDLLIVNGIDGSTGGYLTPPLKLRQLAAVVHGEPRDMEGIRQLGGAGGDFTGRPTTRPLKEGPDPRKLEQTGWGVIFPKDANPEIREALSPLLDHRRAQTTQKHERYYQEYLGERAYALGELKRDFLARMGAGPGPVDPKKVPYYLLIVGDPETIPYDFQYQLDVSYAVGRLHFDTLEEYERYAHAVVAAETGQARLPRRAVFFSARNPDDRATHLSNDRLASPLAEAVARDQPEWTVEALLAEEAQKARLDRLLRGEQPPALLFTASHGMGFPSGHSCQLPHQGALLCQEWPGPKAWRKAIAPDHYFAGEDVASETRVDGMISFHFACFGAGSPQLDNYAHASGKRKALAPHPFVARLPQRLLGRGGALAAIGHIDRAWGYSFLWPKAGQQLTTFESTFKRLLEGHPVGSAMEYINQRHAELAAELIAEKEALGWGKKLDEVAISRLFTALNDARNTVVLGDPAVRLSVGESSRVA